MWRLCWCNVEIHVGGLADVRVTVSFEQNDAMTTRKEEVMRAEDHRRHWSGGFLLRNHMSLGWH